MQTKAKPYLLTHEWLIPLVLAIAFIGITIPGINWGLGGGWNPDEIVQRVISALHGDYVFDETDFLYPSLPKYVMFGLGKIVLALGFGTHQVFWTARLLSVLLGAGVVALAYVLARRSGVAVGFALFAALLVFTNSVLAQNARFAHNDIYLTFFVLLATWAGLCFAQTRHRGWFYAACLFVGLAASSKYTGIALLVMPVILFFTLEIASKPLGNWLRRVETFALGLILTFLGFALGTPKALLWMTFYFKRMIPEFLSQSVYGLQPDSVRGLIGQWGLFIAVLGIPFAILTVLAFGYAIVRAARKTKESGITVAAPSWVIPIAIVAMDLPIMISYIYVARYFLPMVPLIAVIAGQFTQTAFGWLEVRPKRYGKWLFATALVVILVFSALRVIGMILLFTNDARGPAGKFLSGLQPGTSIEYTFYRPYFNRQIFARANQYPLFFPKFPGDVTPTDDRIEYNTGAAGIAERQPDYLIVDSFTYSRFSDPFVCKSLPAECSFFSDLLTDHTNYVLIGDFEYRLPWWVPSMPASFLNPDIRVYQRAQETSSSP